MGGIGSVAWPLAFLAFLAAGYLLFFQAGLAPWFSFILVGAGLLLFVGVSMVAGMKSDDAHPAPARLANGAAWDDDLKQS